MIFVYTRETLIRIVLVALLLYSAVSLSSAKRELNELRRTTGEAETELAALQSENAELTERLRQGKSDEEIAQLARECLGLALPGEKIFIFRQTDGEPK